MVGPEDTVVMRSRFELNNGEIVQTQTDTAARESDVEPVRMAEAWYTRIRFDCFGDAPSRS